MTLLFVNKISKEKEEKWTVFGIYGKKLLFFYCHKCLHKIFTRNDRHVTPASYLLLDTNYQPFAFFEIGYYYYINIHSRSNKFSQEWYETDWN